MRTSDAALATDAGTAVTIPRTGLFYESKARLPSLLFLQRLHVFHDVREFLTRHQLLHVGRHHADLLFDQFFDIRLRDVADQAVVAFDCDFGVGVADELAARAVLVRSRDGNQCECPWSWAS